MNAVTLTMLFPYSESRRCISYAYIHRHSYALDIVVSVSHVHAHEHMLINEGPGVQ